MFIKRLRLVNFKNYRKIDITFKSNVVSLIGRNGMGKTNLLDAIYYLSFTKSAINSSDQQNINHGEDFFSIIGTLNKESKNYKVQCSYQNGLKKVFHVDDCPYEKLSDHIGEFPAVLISPNDTDLVREWSDLRRKFFDTLLCQIDKEYFQCLVKYNHYLKQRNSLLKLFAERKNQDRELIEKYDLELVISGSVIWEKRRDYLAAYLPYFESYYRKLAGKEVAQIAYQSDYAKGDFYENFKKHYARDLATQRTGFGIHRDDFEFLLAGKPLKKIGSQGQQKSFVIALRLGQYAMICNEKKFKPILLLDDIFDKLDDERIKSLSKILNEDSLGQIFITDARMERTQELVKEIEAEVEIFEVVKDGVHKIS
ncbi:MAG: DNA replication and repair protein RecF [Bacteroidetes bacterium]|nr:DNA replication and repair protein RecF [Bacteroidota bacterium]MDA1119030.1 DNA replication and repair protein RecF [Bacteroidota bacterium]